jgi:hypothetical protein
MSGAAIVEMFARPFGALMIVVGCVALIKPGPFSFGWETLQKRLTMQLRDDDERARVAAAIRRREQWEPFDRRVTYAFGCYLIAAGVLGVIGIATYPLLLALVTGGIASVYAYQLLRTMRVPIGVRMATLQRRSLFAFLPRWLLALIAIGWIALPFIGVASHELLASTIALVASLAGTALCVVVSNAPAIVGGDDPIADAYVDDGVRKSRILGLLSSVVVGAFLLATVAPVPPHDLVMLLFKVISNLAYVVVSITMIMRYYVPRPATGTLERV